MTDVQARPGFAEWQQAAGYDVVRAGQDVRSGGQDGAGRGVPLSEEEVDVDAGVAEYLEDGQSAGRGLRDADPVQEAGAAAQSDQFPARPGTLGGRRQPGFVEGAQPLGTYGLGVGEDEPCRSVGAQGHGGDQSAGPLGGPGVQGLLVRLVVAAQTAQCGVGQPGRPPAVHLHFGTGPQADRRRRAPDTGQRAEQSARCLGGFVGAHAESVLKFTAGRVARTVREEGQERPEADGGERGAPGERVRRQAVGRPACGHPVDRANCRCRRPHAAPRGGSGAARPPSVRPLTGLCEQRNRTGGGAVRRNGFPRCEADPSLFTAASAIGHLLDGKPRLA